MYSTLQLVNVSVSDNLMFAGGYCEGLGIYCQSTNFTLTNVVIRGNIADDGAGYYLGGGINAYSNDTATLTNVLITSNVFGKYGNYYEGGGIHVEDGSLINAMNITVSDNHKSDSTSIEGSGVYNSESEFNAVNSILWDENSGPEADTSSFGGTFNISYSNVRGGYAGTGNMDTLPGFVSGADFHLQTSSPCINAGTLIGAPNFDLDNNLRPLPATSNPDMGCFETDQSLNGLVCSADFYLVADTLLLHHYWAVNEATGNGAVTYLWSWGDGNYDSIAYPSHTYSTGGFYTICLTINDSTGCFDSTCYSYNILKMSSAEAENTIVTVDVLDNIPTNIENKNVLRSCSVFPNPASGNSFISYVLSAPSSVSIILCDLLGNKLHWLVNGDQEQGEQIAVFDTHSVANGIYVLQIRVGDQKAEQKIVVMN